MNIPKMDQSYRNGDFSDDTIVNAIIKNHISLKDEDIKVNNQHLQKIIINGLIPFMKKDDLFKDSYKNINYAGSFFKGTKVGKPDEYDLDMRIRLPLNYRTLKVETNHKNYGYVKIKVEENSKLPKWETHSKILNKWLDDQGYLDQNKFRQWMEKVMTKTYEQLEKIGKDYELTVDDKTYTLKQYKKSGPAFTIYVKLKDNSQNSHTMDVDLVPCLEFDNITLQGYKQVPNMIKTLIVVAKPSQEPEGNRLWRLSFYEQEKKILQEHEAGKMKPIIQLIKKLRDKLEWKMLASYYIETLCLHELVTRKSDNDTLFFRAPKTCLFMYMLKKLCEAMWTRSLPYFWHERHNLFDKMDKVVFDNYTHRLYNMLTLVRKNITINRFVIAEQMLSVSEVSSLRDNVLSKLNNDQMEKDLAKSEETQKTTVSIKLKKNIERTDAVKSEETHDIIDSIKQEEKIERTVLVKSEKNYDTTDSVKQEKIIEKIVSLKLEETYDTTDSIKQKAIIERINIVKPNDIKSRVDLICNELGEMSNLKEELSSDQIEKLLKASIKIAYILSQ